MPLDVSAYEFIVGKVPKVTFARRKARRRYENSVKGQLQKADYHTNRAWKYELNEVLLSGQYDVKAMFEELYKAHPNDTVQQIVIAMREHPSIIDDYPEETLEEVVALHHEAQLHRAHESN